MKKLPPIHKYVERQADKAWMLVAEGSVAEDLERELKILQFLCHKALKIIMLENNAGMNALYSCQSIIRISHQAKHALTKMGAA